MSDVDRWMLWYTMRHKFSGYVPEPVEWVFAWEVTNRTKRALMDRVNGAR